MSTTVLDRPKVEAPATTPVNYYAPYWEDDQTLNPTMVRIGTRWGDHFQVTLPSGEMRQVHLHCLGKIRRAS
jgi:hypothetical protein